MAKDEAKGSNEVSATRSWNMSRIRSRDTKPELIVRRLVHASGYRFRLHAKQLPGKPDIVFGSRKRAIFVHGCFWHRHDGCKNATMPKTRKPFWEKKFNENVLRDKRVMNALAERGWSSLVVWECEVRQEEKLRQRLLAFLTA